MKRLSVLGVLLFIFLLVGCKDDPVEIECGENETEENGVCVIVDQDLEDITNGLTQTSALDSYQIDVEISYSDNAEIVTYDMVLQFDDVLSSFVMGEDIVYYEQEASNTYQYVKQGDVFVKETADDGTFDLFIDLEPTWFTKIDDYYLLGSQYLTSLNTDVLGFFPEGQINNFQVVLGDTYIDQIAFNLIQGEETYTITFDFSLYGEVDITLPSV